MASPYSYGGNYRQIIFNYYGLRNDPGFAVHHIDMNRSNMDISNLLILPDRLHRRYHLVLRRLGGNDSGFIDMKITADNINKTDKRIKLILEYMQIQKEMEIWFALKRCRDWLAQNALERAETPL